MGRADSLSSSEHDNTLVENWTTPPESVSNDLLGMNEYSLSFDSTKSSFSRQVLDCDVEADCHTNPTLLQDEVISERPQNKLSR